MTPEDKAMCEEVRAWQITDSDSDRSVLVMARDYDEATREGAIELGRNAPVGCLDIRFMPQFDGGIPSLRERVEKHGWSQSCGSCDHHVYGDGCGIDDCKSDAPIWIGDDVYCSKICAATRETK